VHAGGVQDHEEPDPRGGRIINNGSISAHAPRPNSAPYTSTKHAVTGLTKSSALDGRKYDISVGQIDIGNARTPLASRMADGVPQANGEIKPEPLMDVDHVGAAVLHMANLPLETNVQFITIMATKMPFIGEADVKSRRDFLGGMAALGALGVPGCGSIVIGPESKLPDRDDVIIRNAYVMTMDPKLGDLPDADVHVKNGAIVAVGRDVIAVTAQVIDGRDMVVLPGFVETHWHMWNTLLRSMSGDKREYGYFPTTLALGKAYLPSDMYQGTRLATAEALNSGITFVHDWCHNIRSPQFAQENLRALRESGIRGRFSYGAAQGHPPTRP